MPVDIYLHFIQSSYNKPPFAIKLRSKTCPVHSCLCNSSVKSRPLENPLRIYNLVPNSVFGQQLKTAGLDNEFQSNYLAETVTIKRLEKRNISEVSVSFALLMISLKCTK